MESKHLEAIVKVNAYSGYKANERPINFIMGDKKIEIIKIMERRVEPDRDCFKVKTHDGKTYNLCWIREEDLWKIA